MWLNQDERDALEDNRERLWNHRTPLWESGAVTMSDIKRYQHPELDPVEGGVFVLYEDHEAALADKNQQITLRDQDIESLRQSLAQAERNRVIAHTDAKEARKEVAALNTTCDAYIARKEELIAKLADRDRQVATLAAENAQCKDEIVRLDQARIAALDSQHERIAALTAERDRLREAVEACMTTLKYIKSGEVAKGFFCPYPPGDCNCISGRINYALSLCPQPPAAAKEGEANE